MNIIMTVIIWLTYLLIPREENASQKLHDHLSLHLHNFRWVCSKTINKTNFQLVRNHRHSLFSMTSRMRFLKYNILFYIPFRNTEWFLRRFLNTNLWKKFFCILGYNADHFLALYPNPRKFWQGCILLREKVVLHSGIQCSTLSCILS